MADYLLAPRRRTKIREITERKEHREEREREESSHRLAVSCQVTLKIRDAGEWITW